MCIHFFERKVYLTNFYVDTRKIGVEIVLDLVV